MNCANLEVIHDTKRLCRNFKLITVVVLNPHGTLRVDDSTPQLLERHNGCLIHFLHERGVVIFLQQICQVTLGELNWTFAELDVLEMLLKEESTKKKHELSQSFRHHSFILLGNSNFSECSCSWQFRSDATSIDPLLRISYPIIPERFWPFGSKLVPQLFAHHPTQPREKVWAVKKIRRWVIYETFFAVVVPCWYTPERLISTQQGKRSSKVFIKVRSDIEIIWNTKCCLMMHSAVGQSVFTFDNDDEVIAVLEGCVQSPIVVPWNFVISFELFIFWRNFGLRQIWLLN